MSDLRKQTAGNPDIWRDTSPDLYDELPLYLLNDLETVVFQKYPELEQTKRRVMDWGARHAVMAGSGSAIIGIFDNAKTQADAIAGLQEEGLTVRQMKFLTGTGYLKPFVINLSGGPLPPELR